MKGLSIEQKAKRYDEAFERVWELLSRCKNNRDRRTMVYRVEDIESIFPEVKKSEDEKIRKELIAFLKENHETGRADETWSLSGIERWIAWLEKQGEQKQDVNVQINPSEYVNDMGGNGCYLKNTTQTSTWSKKEEKVDNQNCVKSVDDIKPKFKVGDWVVDNRCGAVTQVEFLEDDGYEFLNGGWVSYENADKYLHLWSIHDAKDGDVVADKSDGTIGIFQSIGHHPDGGSYNDPSYCFLHCRYDDGYFYADFEQGNTISSDDLIPATKEQRDTLFAKMKEAKWEWDAEKKELWC